MLTGTTSTLPTSLGAGLVTWDRIIHGLAWLGDLVIDTATRLAWMVHQTANQAQTSPVPANGGLDAPAILMAGGLATLAVLFAVIVVRRSPTPTRAGGGTDAPASTRGPGARTTSGLPTPDQDGQATGADVPASDHRPAGPQGQKEGDADLPLAVLASGSLRAGRGALPHDQGPQAHPTSNHGASTDGSAPGRPAQAQASPRAVAIRDPAHRDHLERGRKAGSRFDGDSLHALLEHLSDTGIGEPRVLQRVPHLLRIRLSHCRGCSSHASSTSPGSAGCPFEEGFLEAAFAQLEGDEVVVRETACGRQGDPGCDFEIWF